MNSFTKLYVVFFLILGQISCSSDKSGKTSMGDYKSFEVNLLSGEKFHSDSLAGKVVLIDYWATWCTPCIKEVPGYNALYQKYKNPNFIFLPICMDSGRAEKIEPFLDEFGIEYPVYVGNSEARTAFGDLPGYPSTFVIDQNGKIQKRYVGIGVSKIEEIDVIISKLLATN